ncbi:unnamed protein product [Cuscuta europaea]|uniref:Terpene synthase metal-binding domain-containing protein n=1 Tax=Cuscuta europaea TaxID=41803 RepID=A0A9P0YIX7_CUSEU|nr:unnamed protein product [Cuscuta europaea]
MHFSKMSAEQNICCSPTIGGYSRVRGPTPLLNLPTVKFSVSTVRADKHEAFFATFGANLHRRSAIYQPNIWNYDFIQSLHSEFGDVEHQRRAHKLKKEVLRGLLFDESLDAVAKLELIDNIEKMAISHHFEKEIVECLDHIMLSSANTKFLHSKMDLYGTALHFRVLRRYGHDVSQGVVSELEHGESRKWLTKATILSLIVDDIYDIYGSIPDLEILTNAIDMWDPNRVGDLPECMRICFEALDNITNGIVLHICEHKGWDDNSALPCLRRAWADFCKTLLVEAKWESIRYTPTLREYLDNGWISSSGPLLLLQLILGVAQDFSEVMEFIQKRRDLVYNTSLIIRLCNDLGTSIAEMERGDVPSSIQCYMKEEGVTEDVAREHIRNMVHDALTEINNHCLNTKQFSSSMRMLVKCVTNAARVSRFVYQSGDGYGVQDGKTRDLIISCLIEPISLH